MSEPPPLAPPTPGDLHGQRRVRTLVGFCVGALLLGAAAWVVWKDRGDLSQAWTHARAAAWWRAAVLVALPWVSWFFSSLMYWSLMNKDERRGTRRHVPLIEMHAVLASAWLLNYLPARPGMFGRLAYHKVVHDIPLTESVRASFVAIGCGVASMLLLLASTLGAHALSLERVPALTLLVAPGACAALLGFVLRVRGARGEALARTAWALAARYADALSWMARYLVLFSIVGRPLSLVEAAAFTIASQIAAMVPLVGNGLGVREWASGLLAPALPVGIARSLTLSVELLHRAAEFAAALPVGLAAGVYVARRMKRSA